MSDTTNKSLLERAIAAWGKKDSQAFFEVFHDEVIYDDVALGRVMTGHREFREFYEQSIIAFPDINMALVAAVADGENGGAEWVLSGTFTGSTEMMGEPSGKSFSLRGSSVARFKDGKISYLADYWDMVSLSSQLEAA
jgi:steroid delta-isomerase-like uncharacterized protein